MAELNMGLFPQYKSPVEAQSEGFNYAQAVQDAARKNQAYQASQQAGQAYANGDYQGAANTLARSGDIKGADAIRTSQQGQNKAAMEYVAHALPVFKGILQAHANDPDGGRQALGQAFDSIAQEAQMATGLSPQSLANFRNGLTTDPQATLQRLQLQLPVEYTKLGNDLVRRQGDTVTPIYAGQRDAPAGYEYGADKKTLQFTPGGPADPEVVKKLGETKREIIVNNPMPNTGQNQGLKQSIQLRKEFDQLPDVKDFHDVANSYDIIADIARRPPTAQNDLSLIFAYMKMLDPGSVVREGEFANAQNTAGIPDQVRNAYNKALNGQRLNANQRKEFTNTAGGVYQSRKRRYDQIVKQYQGYAKDSGLGDDVIQARIPAGDGGVAAPAADPQTDALLKKYGL